MPGELIAVSEQDEQIFSLWETGKTLRAIAREMGISGVAVEQALDRVLPVLSQVTNARAYKRHLFFMEDLETEFYAIAKRDKSTEAAHLCARLNERVCAMNGWTSVNIRMDPVAAQAAERPSQHEQMRATILAFLDRMPPAQKALRERLQNIDAEEALRLLDAAGVGGKGNGSKPTSEPAR